MPELNSRNTLSKLIENKQLFDMHAVAKMTGYCVPYLRRLCHGQKLNHQRILGRYYMTPKDVADLLTPVTAAKK